MQTGSRQKDKLTEFVFVKFSRDRSERLFTKQNNGNMHNRKFAHLMGVDGMTERTGERSRPTDVYFAKGPNLREVGGGLMRSITHDKHSKRQMMRAAKQMNALQDRVGDCSYDELHNKGEEV